MSKADLKLTIQTINKFTKIPEKHINIESKACDFHQWDSLAQINIVLEIQKKTKIKVSTSKLNELNSVKSILSFFK